MILHCVILLSKSATTISNHFFIDIAHLLPYEFNFLCTKRSKNNQTYEIMPIHDVFNMHAQLLVYFMSALAMNYHLKTHGNKDIYRVIF